MRVCMEIPGRVVSSRDEKKTEREMGRYLDEISGVGADSIATTLIGGYRSNIFRTNTNGIPPVLRVAKERNFKVYLHFSCGYGLWKHMDLDKDKMYEPGVDVSVLKRKFIWPPSGLVNWPCMSWETNRNAAVRIVEEFTRDHDADALLMDFARYPNGVELLREFPCQCQACRTARKAWLGHECFTPAEIHDPAVQYKEIQFRHNCLTEMVKQLRDIVQKKGMKFGLCARARYFEDAVVEGQDWASWAARGLLDVVVPMSFSQTFGWFIDTFKMAVEHHKTLLSGVRDRIEYYEFISKSAELGPLQLSTFKKQIEIVREADIDGVFLYGMEEKEDYEAVKEVCCV